MVDNAGFISTLGTSPSTRIVDGTDNIHSGIINALNIATGENRVVSGFNITQSDGGDYTTYTMTAGTYLRNGKLLSLSQGAVTPSTVVRSGNDHYSVIVINSSEALAVRDGAKDISTISVSVLTAGDIPIAVVKSIAGSANDATNRPIQFLGYAQEERELSVFDNNAETLRINKDGTLTKNNMGIITLPVAGTLATIDGTNLATDAIDTDNIQNNAITSVKISAGAVSTATLADTAVTTAKITNASITTTKLADDSVTADKLASSAVVTASVVDDAITYEKMQNLTTADRVLGSTSTGVIQEVQIVNDMIADNTIAVGKISGLTDLGSGVVVSSAERTKLSGIEASADVTDTTNVVSALSGNLGSITLGDSNDTITIAGNLTVAGSTTTINTGTINLADNILTLNSDATGSASADAGLEVERGNDTNVLLKWNESTNRWTFTNDGSTYYNLPITSEISPYSHPTSVVSNLDTSGAEILDTLETNSTGHITAMTKRTLTKGDLGLGNVENTAISSFTGTSNIATVGTIGTGTWQGTAIATSYIANSAITTAKIANDAVTAAKIADGVIANAAIASDAAIAQSKISGLTTSLNAKQDTISVSDGLDKTGSTIKIDIDSLDVETGIDRDADYFMFDDATPSTDELHKINLTTIFSKLVANDIPALSYLPTNTTAIANSNIASNAAISSDKLADGTNNKLFTATLKSKLDGIAGGAEVNVKSNWNETTSSADSFIENKPTIPSGNQIIDWTSDQSSTNIHAGNYTNTEYSVGDGGLTQVNFTTAKSNKLDGIADNANNFSLTSGAVTNAHLAGSIAQSKITGLTTALGNTITELSDLSITASATEINRLDGILVNATTLNYLSNVTGDIQSQINSKLDSTNVLGYTLTAATSNSGNDVVLKLTGANGGGVSTVVVEGGNSISTSVGNQGQLVLDSDIAVNKTNVSSSLATLTGDDTLYIGDAGDDTTVRVRGNLFVDGTTTTVNQTAINVQNAFVFEGATSDDYETTLTITDPTADRTITLPNITGTLITTGDTGTIANAMIASTAVTSAKLATNSVLTSKINASAVTTAKIAADAVTGAKIADDAIDSEHYIDGSIDAAHLSSDSVTTAKVADDAITYAKIQNVSATDRILGRDSSGAGVIEEITPANLRTMLNIADGATSVSTEDIQDIVGAMFSGNTETNVTATYEDIDGTIDLVVADTITGNAGTATALETARNIGGVSFDGTSDINLAGVNIAGNQDTSGNAATATLATNATHVTVTDNENTDENNLITFIEDTSATGNVGLESDGDFHYNPSTGTVTATVFSGALSGNATTATGLSATLAIASGGTGATNSNGWLNSRITTNADGSLNYDATSATAVNHDSLAGFVAAEHIDWAGASAGTIHSTNIPTLNQTTTGNAATSTLASTVTVADSTANTNFPVVFHNESNALLDDTGALRYNPSTGTLLVPNLVVAGTSTTVDTVTMEAANAVVFEGATDNDYETTLTITDPTADRTITLPNASGTVAVSAGTGIDLSAAGEVSVDVSDFMANGANNRILTATGTDAMTGESTLTYDGTNLYVQSATPRIYLSDTDNSSGSNDGNSLLLTKSGSISYLYDRQANSKLYLGSSDDSDIIVIDGANTRVGINTNSPDTHLHVEGSVLIDAYEQGAGSGLFFRDGFLNTNQPSITVQDHSGANPDGLAISAYDGISFRLNATEKARFDSNGNLGIGTTSPETKLHVDNGTLQLGLQADDYYTQLSNNALMFHRAGASYIDQQTDNGDIRFRMNAANDDLLMLDGSAMRVGIGTTSPDALLHVDTGSDSGTAIIADGDIVVRRQSDNAEGIRFNAENMVSTHADILFHESAMIAAGANMHFAIDSDGSSSSNYYEWRHNGDQSDTGSALMRLTESGKLGIGTDSPVARLQVLQNNAAWTILAGADVSNPTLTDDTRKFMRLGMPHYDTDEESFSLITGDSDDGNNKIFIGGGTSIGNAASNIFFNTAANATTTTGTTRMTIKSDGKVGIGTTSPSTKLHLSDSAEVALSVDSSHSIGSTISLDATATGGDEWRLISAADGAGTTDGTGAFGLYNIDVSAYRLVVEGTTGHVGIGTATPSEMLHVESADEVLGLFKSTDAGAGIKIDTPNDGYAVVFFSEAGTNKWSLGKLANNSDKFSIYDEVNTTPRLVIDTSGNVGIGTTSPASQLDISSASTSTLRLSNSDTSLTEGQITGEIIFYQDDDSGSADGITGRIGMRSSARSDGTYYGNAGDMGFFVAGSGNYSTANQNADLEAITIRAGGKVGIGTTTPDAKLHVQGGANDEVVALFTTAGGTSGSVEGIAHIGLSHFSSDTVPSVSLSAEEDGTSSHMANFRINTRGSDSANAAPTEKLRVTHDGLVGIGTTNPAETLHVKVSSGDSGAIAKFERDSGQSVFIGAGNGWGNIWTDDTVLAFGVSSDYGADAQMRLYVNDDTAADAYSLLELKGNGDNYTNAGISLLALDDDASYRGLGVFMHDAQSDHEWYMGTPYSLADSWVVGRKGSVSSHTQSTSDDANALLIVRNDGKVGIGTTSPSNKLHLALSMADGDDGILLTRTDSSTSQNDILGGIGFDSSDGNIPSSLTEASIAMVAKARLDHSDSDKAGYLDFYYSAQGEDDDTTSTIGMRFMDGKLAVNAGGRDPFHPLTVFTTGQNWNSGIAIYNTDTSIADNQLLGVIGFDSLDGNAPSDLLEASVGIAAYAAEDHSTGDKGADLVFFTSAIDDDDDTTSHERVRLTSEGSFGIGTNAPESKLDVQDGSVRILPTISSNAGTAIRIGARGNSNDITLLRIDGEGSGADGAGNSGESDSAKYGFSMKYMGSGSGEGNRYAMFMDNQGGTAIEAMSILQGGKVGIGTTSPSKELYVTGDVGLSGDIYVEENKKIYFDSTDTYIYGDGDGSEDLHIGADGHIELEADNDTIIKQGSTEIARFKSTGLHVDASASYLHHRNGPVVTSTNGNAVTIEPENAKGHLYVLNYGSNRQLRLKNVTTDFVIGDWFQFVNVSAGDTLVVPRQDSDYSTNLTLNGVTTSLTRGTGNNIYTCKYIATNTWILTNEA